MRRLFSVLMLIALVLGGMPAASQPGIATAAESSTRTSFGVVEAFEARDFARQSGARWQRIAFFWNSIQPESSTQWLPNHYSTTADVSSAIADGVVPVGLIGNPPNWATRNGSVPSNLDLPISDPNNHWARFVGRLVGQYAGQINYWIIWNEPDITAGQPGSTWAGSEEEYYKLMKTAALAARAANPHARIVFAGTTYWFDFNRGEPQFFERVLDVARTDPTAAANGYYFDAVDVHLYSTPDRIPIVADDLQKIMARFGLNKPLWMSELNVVPANDPNAIVPRGGFRASLTEQSAYVIQALALARSAGVERAAIYKMKDGDIINGEPYGLIRNDLSARPAFNAFQVAAKYLMIDGKATASRNGDVQRVVIDGGDRRVTALWALGPDPETATVMVAGARATLVASDGTTTTLTSPLKSGNIQYSISLPGATCNTDDADPTRYIIGGAPFVLVEEGVGDEVEISPTEAYFPKTGFTTSGAFLDFYRHRGGARTFGLPVSRPFKLEGHTVQFFQRQVMELRSDGTVGLLNILDQGLMPYTTINGATFPAIDSALIKTAPLPGTPGYASKIIEYTRANAPDTWSGMNVGFGRTFAGTVSASDAFSGKNANVALLPGLNLEIWGAPTSKPAQDPRNGSFVYQRFQRGIMHFDRQTGKTQGLLLADYLKAIMTGKNLPPDLAAQAKASRFYGQYDPSRPLWLSRADRLLNTDLTNAFEPGR